MGKGDRPRKIGDEDERALEDRDEEEVPARVVARDLRSDVGDTGPDLLLGEVDVADAVTGGLYEASFRPYLCARRSKSRL